MSKFKIPKENWKSIPVKSAEFILNENKDYIDYTLKAAEKITNRASFLILILITLLSAIVGYSFDTVINNGLTSIIYINFFFIFTITFLIIYLSLIIFPKKIMVKGRLPRELAQERFLILPKLTEKESYLMFVIQEIENSQVKIDFNLKQNEKLGNKMKTIMYAIVILLPVYLVIAFLLVS